MKLTETKLKQMILNEMNSSPVDPIAEKLAEKFKGAGTDSPLVRQIYELAIALGHAPEEGFVESFTNHPNFGGAHEVIFIASPDLSQAMQKKINGVKINPDKRFPGMFKVEYVIN